MNRRQLLLGATAAVVAPVLPPGESLWGGDPYLLTPYRRSSMKWELLSPEEILQDISAVMQSMIAESELIPLGSQPSSRRVWVVAA